MFFFNFNEFLFGEVFFFNCSEFLFGEMFFSMSLNFYLE